MFNDDRYYEFICFDVPKVVQSPGCDHGHGEESRNGRDIKIDILEGYVWTPERFRVVLAFFWSIGTLPEPPEELMGLNGLWWKRGGGDQGGGAPPSPIRIGRGAGPPFLLSLSLFLLLLLQLGRGETYSYWDSPRGHAL